MFTGIVEELGEVADLTDLGDSVRLTVRGPLVVDGARHGDSIAVNGVCLTVVDADGETLHRRRDARDPRPQRARRPARRGPGQPGAADAPRRPARRPPRAGPRRRRRPDRGTRSRAEHWEVVRISLPADLERYVVHKGSITVDGVSLTVASVAPGDASRSA